MRIGVAALLGAIVMFTWGFVSHMLLPLGEMGFKAPTNEDAVLASVRDGLPGEGGITMVPWLGAEGMNDPAKVAAYEAKSAASPYALVVYQAQGGSTFDMGANLGKEFATNLFCAAILAWILAAGAFAFGRRVLVAALMGVFAWGAISVPYWNWYRFPLDFTLANLAMQVVGWTLAGAAIAWWLGRGERAPR
jgi:hypothetical protein